MLFGYFNKNDKEKILYFYNFFLMHLHVLMLCINFELIPIKFKLSMNF